MKNKFSIKSKDGHIFTLLDTHGDPSWSDANGDIKVVEKRHAPDGTLLSVVNHRDKTYEQRKAELQHEALRGTAYGKRGGIGPTAGRNGTVLKKRTAWTVVDEWEHNILARYPTQHLAEKYIAWVESLSPADAEEVHKGRYGIDSPEE